MALPWYWRVNREQVIEAALEMAGTGRLLVLRGDGSSGHRQAADLVHDACEAEDLPILRGHDTSGASALIGALLAAWRDASPATAAAVPGWARRWVRVKPLCDALPQALGHIGSPVWILEDVDAGGPLRSADVKALVDLAVNSGGLVVAIGSDPATPWVEAGGALRLIPLELFTAAQVRACLTDHTEADFTQRKAVVERLVASFGPNAIPPTAAYAALSEMET